VLRAMKLPFAYLRGAVRFSFARDNSEQDVDRVLDVLPQLVSDLQAQSVAKGGCV
jgi:cysteine desulfurase